MISAPVACTPVEGHGTPIARQAPGTRQFVFLALPGYSFLALSNAVEALRMANRIVGRPVYEWVVASLTGQSETASNGFTITPTRAIDEHLLEAASLMHANLEEPLPLDQIADLVGTSRRQIERLFKRHIGQVPTKYYLDLRLQRARSLLLQTPLSIMEVSIACGFRSSAHFCKCYREAFGRAPSSERCIAHGRADFEMATATSNI